ncbi:MAG: diaminopimelate dehydrogenase [Angelakisella sp.]
MTYMIRIGIAGYGNIGKGVEQAIARNSDMELVAVVTRRDPASIKTQTLGVKVVAEQHVAELQDSVDVMILCGGSATDLPEQGPRFAACFNTVDSFDTHANIPTYFEAMDSAAKAAGNLSLISCGWDPGLFSILRTYGTAALPQGESYTFWGRGVSQGHSDALRRVKGVKNAIQYTVPVEEAVNAVRSGVNPQLTTRQKHLRECYVVAEEGADREKIVSDIKTMPNYFVDYDTTVNFITEEELRQNHSKMPHGGMVLRSGDTGVSGNKHVVEFQLTLDSNPEFTASVLVAYARAVYRLSEKGQTGCVTVLDIAPGLLTQESPAELRKRLL